MILSPLLVTLANFIVRFPMAYTPILLALGTRFLSYFSKLLVTKVLIFFIMIWTGFCVRQIFIGQTKQHWTWMIIYLMFSLFILLYTRKNKGYDNITSFRLAIYSIWGTAFLKELVWYIKSNWFRDFLNSIVEEGQLLSMDWMIWGFHVSCVISVIFFFSILIQFGWQPSQRWIALFGICFLIELFIVEPACRVQVVRYSWLAGSHRLPWFVVMFLAVFESPQGREK